MRGRADGEEDVASLWRDGGLRALIGPTVWEELLSLGVPAAVPAGTVLMRQGQPGTHVLLVIRGLVKVKRLGIDGTDMLIAVRGPGELLGEMSVIDGGVRSATLTTLLPSITRRVSAAEFLRFVNARGLGLHLARLTAMRQRQNELLRMDLATLQAPQRLVRLLRQLADAAHAAEVEHGGDADQPIVLAVTQQELADAIGASRSVVAQELQELRQSGVVETGRGQLAVLALARLRRLDRRRP